MVGNPAYFSIIRYAKQNHTAGGVGKGAYLASESGGTGALELGGETFTEGDEVAKGSPGSHCHLPGHQAWEKQVAGLGESKS